MARSLEIDSACSARDGRAQSLEEQFKTANNTHPLLRFVQDPQIDRAIGPLVYDCVGKLNASLTPRPVAIVLTGSFARGEGSVCREGDRLRVLGDMEFMVFFEPAADLDHLQAVLQESTATLERHMQGAAIDCRLEFSAVSLQYLSTLRPHIFAYELLRHGRILYGFDVLRSAPQLEVVAIPKWDAWRMLNNRVIEQLEAAGMLKHGSRSQLRGVFYQVVKCYLDTATTLLIFGERYRDTYAKRATELRVWASEPHLPRECLWLPVIADRVSACTAFKLSPDTTRELLGVWPDDPDTDRLRAAVSAAVLELVAVVHEVWRWETARLSGCSEAAVHDNQLRDAVLKLQPRWGKLRGWAKLALMPELRRQRGFVRRMFRLLHRGSPRYLTYCVASSLFFALPQLMTGKSPELRSLDRLLPVIFDQYSDEPDAWWRLRNNVLSGWHLFLRNHWA